MNQEKNCRMTLNHLHLHQVSPLLPFFHVYYLNTFKGDNARLKRWALRLQSYPPSSLCCPKPPSHHSSNLTSVYPVSDLCLLSHQHPYIKYGTQPFSECVQTISIFSDFFYFKTLFPFQLFHASPHSKFQKIIRTLE